jgi:hypothetical protein
MQLRLPPAQFNLRFVGETISSGNRISLEFCKATEIAKDNREIPVLIGANGPLLRPLLDTTSEWA